jgi:hypothetical protein
VVLGVDLASLSLEGESVGAGRLRNSDGEERYPDVSLVVSEFSLEEHVCRVSSSEGILLSFAMLRRDGGLDKGRRG